MQGFALPLRERGRVKRRERKLTVARRNKRATPQAPPPRPTMQPGGLSGQLLRMAGAVEDMRPDFDALARDIAAGREPGAVPGVTKEDSALAAQVARARHAAAAEPMSALRQLELADALRRAGQNDAAIAAAKRCLALDPDAIPAQFLLASLTGAQIPETMPPALVATIFDASAARFDQMLVGNLKYQGPELIAKALAPLLPKLDRGLDVLDAGCGTGLCAAHLRPIARRLDGVDLSPRMIEAARARNAYDRLVVGDLVAALLASPGAYDLIVAADVLVYVGALEKVFAASHAALRPNGLLAFSVERGTGGRFSLSPASRYRHDPDYVEAEASRAGFALRHKQDCVLRFENRKPIDALIYVHVRR